MVAPKTRWVDALGGSVRRQTQENRQMRAAIAAIREQHQPIEEEAEFFFDAEKGPSEHCAASCTYATCAGHCATVKVCRECGYEHDGESPVYRSWPCPTIHAIDGLTGGSNGTS